MAADRSLAPSAALIGAALLLPVLLGLGSGPMNGDAAAYAAQAAAGVVADRWTHLGYLGPAALLGRQVDPGRALDLGSWLSAVVCVAAVVRIRLRAGGDPRLGAVLAAAIVAPWAAFAEVDLPWIAATLLAVAASPGWIALAVAISPTALLALPWALVARTDRRRELVGSALLAVVALTIASGGLWWTGERGVLQTGPLALGKTALAFGRHLSWLVLVLVAPDDLRRLPACLPLLLAPPDVPAWLVPGIAAACTARTRRWAPLVVGIQLALSATETVGRIRQVREETALVRAIVDRLGPADGVVAPWTWGARIAVEASGDPYGIRWHPPGRFLRDQRGSWCSAPPERALAVPPGDVWLDAAAIRSPCSAP